MQERCPQSACHQICVAGIQKFRKSWPKMLRWYPARPPPTVRLQGVGIGRTIAGSKTNPNIASGQLPPKNFLEASLIYSWRLNAALHMITQTVLKSWSIEWWYSEPGDSGTPVLAFAPLILIWAIRGGHRRCDVEGWLGLINKTVRPSSQVKRHLRPDWWGLVY